MKSTVVVGKKPWKRELRRILKSPKLALRSRSLVYYDTPVIVNMVSTTWLLEQNKGYTLPLRAIAMALGDCSQYAPQQFAANIIHLTTNISGSTVLVFASGKLVITATLSDMHIRLTSQLFRLMFENIECVLQLPEEKMPVIGNLKGRTVLQRNITHNIVGHAALGFHVDLASLRDANQAIIEWAPKDFPAAKARIWLTADKACHCGYIVMDETLIKKKCLCAIKCLIYDGGAVVLTGGRLVRDVNSVFYQMKDFLRDYQPGKVKPSLKAAKLPFMLLDHQQQRKARKPHHLKTSEALAMMVLNEAQSCKTKEKIDTTTNTNTNTTDTTMDSLFIRIALSGSLANVKTFLAIEEDFDHRVAIPALEAVIERTVEQEEVLKLLLASASPMQMMQMQ